MRPKTTGAITARSRRRQRAAGLGPAAGRGRRTTCSRCRRASEALVGELAGPTPAYRPGRPARAHDQHQNLDAYELYLLGIEHKHRITDRDCSREDYLLRAMEIDPTSPRLGRPLHRQGLPRELHRRRARSPDASASAPPNARAADPTTGLLQAVVQPSDGYLGPQAVQHLASAAELVPNSPTCWRPHRGGPVACAITRAKPGPTRRCAQPRGRWYMGEGRGLRRDYTGSGVSGPGADGIAAARERGDARSQPAHRHSDRETADRPRPAKPASRGNISYQRPDPRLLDASRPPGDPRRGFSRRILAVDKIRPRPPLPGADAIDASAGAATSGWQPTAPAAAPFASARTRSGERPGRSRASAFSGRAAQGRLR